MLVSSDLLGKEHCATCVQDICPGQADILRLAPRRRQRCGLESTFEAVSWLCDLYKLLDMQGPLEGAEGEDAVAHAVGHNRAYESAGGRYKFKRHQVVHLCERLSKCGRPRFYSTYMDESVNRLLSQVTASVSAHTYSRNALVKYLLLQ